MSLPCQNPERQAAGTRLLPIALSAVLSVAAGNAWAQPGTAPDASNGPKAVAVTGLFPNGSAPPPPDRIGRRFEGNELAIANGKALFGEMNCTGCHFNGGGGMGPALMSGHWRYGGRIEQIYESIAQGRPNGMPTWQFALEPVLIWDLAAYVKSLSEPAPSSAVESSGTSGRP